MASSVEFGPGIRFVAPTRSRNSWSLSHFRRFTVSLCIMAIWAAGPPKAVMPNLRNNAATSVNLCDNGDFIFAPFYVALGRQQYPKPDPYTRPPVVKKSFFPWFLWED